MFRRASKKSQQSNPYDIPLGPVDYPAGIYVRTAKGNYLINKDGKRYRIATRAILESWSFPIVVITTEEALKKFPVAISSLPFRDGSLLNNIADGKLYLVSGGKLRHITSPNALLMLHLTKHDAVDVSDAEIKSMMKNGMGEDLN